MLDTASSPPTRPTSRLGRPVDADGAATRRRILKVARAAFAELGYAATTYRILAERAGLAPSALYNYFASKAELYAEVHDEVRAEVYEGWLVPALEGAATLDAALDAFLVTVRDLNHADPTAASFLATARVDTVRSAELAAVRDALPARRRDLFEAMVEQGVRDGVLGADVGEQALALLETVNLGLLEISADPARHRAAVEALRRGLPLALRSLA
jgi:AcrR family transcriptional regulator